MKVTIDKMDKKEYYRYMLAQMQYAREFLYYSNIITEKENENIHKKIMRYQDKHKIGISMQQLNSVYMEYNDNATDDVL